MKDQPKNHIQRGRPPFLGITRLIASMYGTEDCCSFQVQRFFPTADRRFNAQFYFGAFGAGMDVQWYGDQASLEQLLNASGITSVPNYTVCSTLENSLFPSHCFSSLVIAAYSAESGHSSIHQVYLPPFFAARSARANSKQDSSIGFQTATRPLSKSTECRVKVL